jgi:hypothetical protein
MRLILPLIGVVVLGACVSGPQPTTGTPEVARARRPQAPRFTPRASLERAPAPEPAGCDPLCERYVAATAAAKYPTTQAISQGLTALLPSTPGLVWKDGKILMGTWTELGPFKNMKPGQPFKLDGDTWWTAVPVMQQWCQSTGLRGDALRVRIAQRLGMPPNAQNDGFVEVWVNPVDIFRPCPDPEIEDRECQVEIPMVPPYQHGPNDPPWACSGVQVPNQFAVVQPSHLTWMCTNWTGSYTNKKPFQNYPWTALGYTYDWGASDHVGPSEFVSLDQTEVVFQSATRTDDYCSTAKQTPSR